MTCRLGGGVWFSEGERGGGKFGNFVFGPILAKSYFTSLNGGPLVFADFLLIFLRRSAQFTIPTQSYFW
jgi:hypothetical protein